MNYTTILASLTALVIAATGSIAQDSHKSGPFQGAKANTGYVTHTTENGNSVLTLSVPKYVPDIAKVQIWCAFAETNLGEAVFQHPVK